MTTPPKPDVVSEERLAKLISRTGPGDLLHIDDEQDMNAALRELLAAREELARAGDV